VNVKKKKKKTIKTNTNQKQRVNELVYHLLQIVCIEQYDDAVACLLPIPLTFQIALVFLFAAISFESYLFPTRVHRITAAHERHLHCLVGDASVTRRRAFVHKAPHEPRRDDASLVLSGDLVRLDDVLDVAEHWHGPIVVALRVLVGPDVERDVEAIVNSHTAALPTLFERIDIHLLYMDRSAGCGDTELYLFAAEFARTDWLVDVPRGVFLFRDTREHIVRFLAYPSVELAPSTVLVMPYFVSQLPLSHLPRTKRAVVEALLRGLVDQLEEASCIECQQPIDIDRWIHAATPYLVE
jgi:hypothetical protein